MFVYLLICTFMFYALAFVWRGGDALNLLVKMFMGGMAGWSTTLVILHFPLTSPTWGAMRLW